MLQHKSYEINSTDDIELGIKRESKLEFKISFDDAKVSKALFVFINGIRNSDYAGYEEHLAEFVVKTYEVAVLRVDYHCIGFRPQTGATFYMDKRDKTIFADCCQWLERACGTRISLPDDFWDNEILNQNESEVLLDSLDNVAQALKNQGKIAPNYRLPLTMSLQPTKGEYNNFGVMQALDILNAICFVRKNYAEFNLNKTPKTLLFGTSHGGYLAFLCAKFAPWLIDAVVENSGYTIVPFGFYSLGKDFDFTKFFEVVDIKLFNNIAAYIFTKTHFSGNVNAENFFCAGMLKIRNPLNESQLETQAKHHKSVFVSYHGIKDMLDNAENKERHYEILHRLGYETRLRVVRDEGEIDGKFIKNLEHGMGMSLKTLIQKELPPLLKRKFTHEKDEKREITYESEGLEYKFKEKAGKIELSIKRL